MIAIARPHQTDMQHDRFLAMLPKIRENARFAFRKCQADVRDEMVAEVVANAYCAFARLVRQDRADLAYATPLADFAIRQVRAGRRVGQPRNVRDVTSHDAEARHGITIERLDRFDDERQEWQEVLVEDKKAGPAETAAARIDFATWLRQLSSRDRRIAKTLARGESTQTAAKQFGISLGRVSQLRRELKQSWERLHGEVAAA